MSIFDYTNLPTITVPYILRDEDNLAVGVYVTNQETKEQLYCLLGDTALFYDGYFTVDVTDILDGITENTSLLVKAVDSNGNPIYRDIVVFSTRLDTVADYEQNDTNDEFVYA